MNELKIRTLASLIALATYSAAAAQTLGSSSPSGFTTPEIGRWTYFAANGTAPRFAITGSSVRERQPDINPAVRIAAAIRLK